MTEDRRPEHLAWVEIALRSEHSDLPDLRLAAQSHYGPPDAIAFVEIYGLERDRDRRRKVRAQAGDFLCQLGYRVELEAGRDVYDVKPDRPVSSHEALRMLQNLRAACGASGTED